MRFPSPLHGSPSLALSAALLLGAAACGPATLHGTLEVFGGGTPTYFESEPNDSAAGPDYLTTIAPGERLEVCGHVDDGCCDPYDGFALETTDAVDLRLELTAHDGWSDLDLCVFDPVSDVFLACFESAGSFESGTVAIALPAEVHLVVRAWSGSSDYTLRVEADALPGWFQAQQAGPADGDGWEGYRPAAEPLVLLDVRGEAAQRAGVPPRLVARATGPAPRR